MRVTSIESAKEANDPKEAMCSSTLCMAALSEKAGRERTESAREHSAVIVLQHCHSAGAMS